MSALRQLVSDVRGATARKTAALALVGLPSFAFAETAAEAIAGAQTTALAVAAALVGLVIAVWAALYVKRFFGK